MVPADGLGGVEVEAAHERRQSAKQDSFGFGQQRVRPIHGRAQCLLPTHRGPGAAGEQSEAVVQAVDDLVQRQRPHPRGGQFDGQRHAVESAADLGDCLDVVVGDSEVGPDPASAVGEQLDSLVGSDSDGTCQFTSPETMRGSRLVARIVTRERRRAVLVDQFGAGLEQVLAVVEHQQQSDGRGQSAAVSR